MANIAIIKNGVIENTISVDDNTRSSTRIFWENKGYICLDDVVASPGDLWDGTNIIRAEEVVENVSPITKLSKLEFMNKFTNAELGAIYTIAKTQVDIEVWLDKFKLAEYVDITDANTISGIQNLELFGLLDPGRASVILSS